AHVLVADDAHDAALAPDGHVQHGDDAERLEVAGGELAGARVRARILGDDHAQLAQRPEVAGVGGRLEAHAAAVAAAAALVEAAADDGAGVVGEEPDADALDAHRFGR